MPMRPRFGVQSVKLFDYETAGYLPIGRSRQGRYPSEIALAVYGKSRADAGRNATLDIFGVFDGARLCWPVSVPEDSIRQQAEGADESGNDQTVV